MPRQDSPSVKVREINPSDDPWGYRHWGAYDLVPDGTSGTTIEAYGTDDTQQLYGYRCTQSEGSFTFFANCYMPMDYAPGGKIKGYVEFLTTATYAGGAGVTGSTMVAIVGSVRMTHPLYPMPKATSTNSLSTTVNAAGASVGTNVWLADNYAYSTADIPAEIEIHLQPTDAGVLYPNDGTSGQTLPGDLFQWKITEQGEFHQSMAEEVIILGAHIMYEKAYTTDT